MPSSLYWTRQAREDLREVLQGNYRLIYRVLEMRLDILAVYHGSRILGQRGV